MPVAGTTISSGADFYSAMIEVVAQNVPILMEQTDSLNKLIGKGKVETISDRGCRVPLVKYVGGTFQAYNPDGGVIGSGSGPSLTHMLLGYVYSNYGIALTNRARDASATAGQSRVQSFAFQQAHALKEISTMADIVLHTDGSGLVTNSASAVSGTPNTITFAGTSPASATFPNPWATLSATDHLGVNLLREGMSVNVWDSTLATNRANATNVGYPAKIVSIDYDARSVTLDSTITGATTGDRLAFPGVTTATLTTANSAGPLTSDSFRHGMPYINGVNTAWYYNTILRSSFPQINPTAYNAQGQMLTPLHVLIARDRTYQRRDASVFQGMFGVFSMAQRAQIFANGISVSEWQRGQSDEMIDMLPKSMDYESSVVVGGLPHYISKRQPRNRVDYINPSKLWGRAQLFDLRPKKFGDFGYLMPKWNSSGQLIAAEEMFWEESYDNYCLDPGAQMVIYNVGVQSGYTFGT